MRKKVLLIALLGGVSCMFAQNESEKQWILSRTNVAELRKMSEQFRVDHYAEKEYALKYAQANNIPVTFETPEGVFMDLQKIEDGKPIYYATNNLGAANTTKASRLWSGGSLGLSCNGQGMIVGEWDGGKTQINHVELINRAIQKDNSTMSYHYHANHVAGTLIAAGNTANAKGMGHQATLWTNDWNDDETEMTDQAAQGLILSNHSYGYPISSIPTWWRGNYISDSRNWDNIAFNAPYYLPVKAAGNDRNDGYGSYDLLSGAATAKNVMVIGAVNGVSNYTGPSSVVMSSFSSWGPTDDGRIKPDVVAKGVSVYSTGNSSSSSSTTAYGTLSGTSMASPNACGTLLLVQQHYKNLNGGTFMRSSTLRGLAIHTAEEAGNAPGPDYSFGWGLLNAEKMANAITNRGTSSIVEERVLNNNATYTTSVTAAGSGPLEVSICWIDRPGPLAANGVNNPTTRRLVNDLDVRVSYNGTTTLPWVLDPAANTAPAVKADNDRDNVEKIIIDNPVAGASYTITVSHKGSLVGNSQEYSFIVTGITSGGGGSSCGIPNNVIHSSVTSSAATISWAAVSGATSYLVEYKTTAASVWTPVTVSAPSVTTTISGLSASTTYNYRVTAICASGQSNPSPVANFTTAGQGGSCGTPAGLSSSAITSTSATLSWTAVSGASGYNLQWRQVGSSTWNNVPNLTTNSYNLSGLTASTNYEFQVQAVCSSGAGSYSSPVGFATTSSGGGSSCGTPSGLSTSNVTCSSVVISWGAVSGATSYSLQYKTTTSSSWVTVPNPTSPYTLTGLAASTTYNYRVRATCGNNIGVYSASTNFSTPSCGGGSSCGTPTGLTSSGVTSNSATVSWSPVGGATSYEVEYKVTTSSTWTLAGSPSAPPATIVGLSPSTSYNYRVRAICGANTGAWSAVSSFTTTASGGGGSCGVPAGITSIPSGISAVINWNVVSGATSYAVQYRGTGTSTWTTVSNITTPPTIINGLLPDSCYEYQVRAVCGNNIGTWSASNTFCTGSYSCGIPGNIDALSISSNSATVTWDDVVGATYYLVQYKATSASTWITSPQVNAPLVAYNLTGLNGATSYDYRVQAVCSGVQSGYSPHSSFTTLPGASGCGQPTNVVVATTTTSATLTCDPIPGATAFVIQHRTVGSSTWSTALQNTNVLGYTITGLMNATAYEYRVYAICGNVLSSPTDGVFITGGSGGGNPPCNDTYEPNNSSSAAMQIPVNQDVNATINPQGDWDWFLFQNTANQPNIQVILDNLVADYDIVVYRPSGGYVASLNAYNAPEMIVMNNAAVGTYYIRVWGYNGANGPSCYRLRANIGNVAFRLQEMEAAPFTVYPNPTTGNINIPILKYKELGQEISISVLDQVGRQVSSISVNSDNTKEEVEMNLSDLPDGIYNIVIRAGEFLKTEKVILAH